MTIPHSRGYLLDTHVALWAVTEPERLSQAALAIVLAGGSVISVVSYWEVAIKSMKGGIDLGDLHSWWAETLEKLVATPLVLIPEHVDALQSLPPIHRDPFDRMLIAQASAEGLTLVSMDATIRRYANASLTIIG